MTTPLTPKQRSHLRSLAHHLKPIHQIGKDGLSETSVEAILEAFNHRELLKVRIQDAAPVSAREAGSEIATRLPDIHHVQTIGKVIVLYRRHPEKPQISLV